ncbi:MAG: hypothetical protein R6U78_02845 [Bacteroidales bacterium]
MEVLPVIVIVTGLVNPSRSPDQPVNVQPGSAVAFNTTVLPEAYVDLSGFADTVPLPTTLTVRVYSCAFRSENARRPIMATIPILMIVLFITSSHKEKHLNDYLNNISNSTFLQVKSVCSISQKRKVI